jgi:hypothetical protein
VKLTRRDYFLHLDEIKVYKVSAELESKFDFSLAMYILDLKSNILYAKDTNSRERKAA